MIKRERFSIHLANLSRYHRGHCSLALSVYAMGNPKPVQSDLLKEKRFQRVVVHHSCVPEDVALASRAISVKLPTEVDGAVRGLGKQKAAWLREVICRAALKEGLVDEL